MPDVDNAKFDQDAMMQLLGQPKPGASSTLPVQAPAFQQTPASAPAPSRRGWNNLNLDAPTQTGLNQFHGFNDQRALSGGDDDSVKDAARRWAGGLDFDLRGKSKDQIGEFLRGQMGNAKDYGLDIQDVQGEKILINTKERGPEWIDFVEGAGGDNPAFQWLSEFDTMGEAALGPKAAPMGMAPMIAPAPADDDAMAQILKEIEALQSGAASPMDQNALLELL